MIVCTDKNEYSGYSKYKSVECCRLLLEITFDALKERIYALCSVWGKCRKVIYTYKSVI